jgi:hypothetical protein
MAQLSKFSLAVQTTTIETPLPFGSFTDYKLRNGYKADYSIEILGRYFLNKNLALRLRTGITHYDLKNEFAFFSGKRLKGQLQKYAIGIESRRILGDNLGIRFGCDVQIGFFKDMMEESEGDVMVFTRELNTNTVLSLNPLMGADWFIWRGLSLSAELRLPFERIRADDKGTFNKNEPFDNGSYNIVGFGKPICSFQIGYQF